MKNKKITCAILICIFIIIAIICVLIKINNKNENSQITNNNVISDKNIFEEESKFEKVKSMQEYYTTINCIQDYLKTIYEFEIKIDYQDIGLTEPTQKSDEEISKSLYNILDKQYLNKNNISTKNIKNSVELIKNMPAFKVNEMYKKQQTENICIYIVKGKYKENDTKLYIVSIDTLNSSYSIQPIMDKYENLNDLDVDFEINSIEKNIDNAVRTANMNEQIICRYYLMDYKNKLKNDKEAAYTQLNKEYREKRFPTNGIFEEYLTDNKECIEKITLDKYKCEEKEGYTEYICQDKYGNTFIFEATAAMEYTVQLDTYTSYDAYINKYKKESDEQKVVLNIGKFIEMINTKNYIGIYNHLDEQFKNENFEDYETFKKYIQNNFFEFNQMNYQKEDKYGDEYIYKIVVTEKNTDNKKQIEKQIVVKLQENNEFVMSFEI